MRGIKRWMGVCLMGAGVAWAQPAVTAGTLGALYADTAVVGFTQSRVVVYRPANPALPAEWQVQLQGRPHAALMAGAFSSDCLPPGMTRVSLRSPSGSAAGADMRMELEAGQTQYWRLSPEGDGVALTVVPEAQARRELMALRQQLPANSRLAIACQPEPSPLEVQAVDRELLPIGGMWASDGQALTETGALMLDALATQWQRDFVRVDRVRVVGHAQDVQAPAERDAALQRARWVRQALASKVGRQWRYQVEVQALHASALAGCGGISPQRLSQECPLASRAVAVEVLGVRR